MEITIKETVKYNDKYNRNRDALIAKILDAKKASQIIIEKLNSKYGKIFKREMQINADHIIDYFYNDYTPQSGYDRKGDLYNAYEIYGEPDDWNVVHGSEFMKFSHHQSNEIIYNNVYKQGYHGGSLGKADELGITPSVPSYRRPSPGFKYWGRPALQSESPYELIEELIDITGYDLSYQATDEYEKLIEPFFKDIERAWQKYIGG